MNFHTPEKDRCFKLLQYYLKNDEKVKKLLDSMHSMGCKIPVGFIDCANCSKSSGPQTGAYYTTAYKDSTGRLVEKNLVLCYNRLRHEEDFKENLIHELIHAYDDCRSKYMMATSCDEIACSEIRAAVHSGQCKFKSVLRRGKIRTFEKCVRETATNSLKSIRNCVDSIDKVWERCYKDNQPFDD